MALGRTRQLSFARRRSLITTGLALPAIAFIASAADDGSNLEAWVGYESLHPLTWLPAQDAIGLA